MSTRRIAIRRIDYSVDDVAEYEFRLSAWVSATEARAEISARTNKKCENFNKLIDDHLSDGQGRREKRLLRIFKFSFSISMYTIRD